MSAFDDLVKNGVMTQEEVDEIKRQSAAAAEGVGEYVPDLSNLEGVDRFDVLVKEGVMTQEEVDDIRRGKADTDARLAAVDDVSDIGKMTDDLDAMMAEAKAAISEGVTFVAEMDDETAARHRDSWRSLLLSGVRVDGLYSARQSLPAIFEKSSDIDEQASTIFEDYWNGKSTSEETTAAFDALGVVNDGLEGEWGDILDWSNSLMNVKLEKIVGLVDLNHNNVRLNYEVPGVTDGLNFMCSDSDQGWADEEEAKAAFPDYVKEKFGGNKSEYTHYMMVGDPKAYPLMDI